MRVRGARESGTAAEAIFRQGWEPHVRVGFPFEVRRAEGDQGERIIEGTASVEGFHGDGILLDPTGFPEAIRDYLEFGLIQSGHRLLPEYTIGRALGADYVAGVGMGLRGMISRAPDVESIWVKIKEELLRAYSLGFFVLDGVYDNVMDVFRATKFAIPEVSVVPSPADRGALFSVSRSFRGGVLDRMRSGDASATLRSFLSEVARADTPEPKPKRRVVHIGHGGGLDEDILAVSAAASAQQHSARAALVRAFAERVRP